MIYWHFRNLQCIILSFFGSKLIPGKAIVRRFFANPFDSDWGNSIQAGRFFTYTDAARWEIAGRTGFLKYVFRNKLVIIIGGQKIIYRKPVKIFRFFHLQMSIVGWDEKWIYAAHNFQQNNKTCCVSFTKIGLRSKTGLKSPVEAFGSMGFDQIPPPDWIKAHFHQDLEAIHDLEQHFS